MVIGTRTAVFAPVERLGLVVVDEAHDGGYKSDRTPRYDARWAARRRAVLTGARVVLGTATPDVVTVARVRGGLIERARLRERRVGSQPTVEVVDMRAELADGNRSIFSRPLREALVALRARYGAGDPAHQPARHRHLRPLPRLRREPALPRLRPALRLPRGGGVAALPSLRPDGPPAGALPELRLGPDPLLRGRHAAGRRRGARAAAGPARSRLDSDALAARRGFEAIYDDFRDGRSDVLVGTQLAAKGLDLPSVTLAAVIAADVTLNLPDYLAPERTFQLLAQVAGRAGRGPISRAGS